MVISASECLTNSPPTTEETNASDCLIAERRKEEVRKAHSSMYVSFCPNQQWYLSIDSFFWVGELSNCLAHQFLHYNDNVVKYALIGCYCAVLYHMFSLDR